MLKKTAKDLDQPLRKHLLDLLSSGHAHATFDEVFHDLPEKLRGTKVPGIPHSAWMLLEHLRIAQWDILEFSRNKKHVSPNWPSGYWPKHEAPRDALEWNKSIENFRADSTAMQDLVADPRTDLFKRIPWGEGQTILRETLLVADHNAYHLGQLVDLRRLLGAWKK